MAMSTEVDSASKDGSEALAALLASLSDYDKKSRTKDNQNDISFGQKDMDTDSVLQSTLDSDNDRKIEGELNPDAINARAPFKIRAKNEQKMKIVRVRRESPEVNIRDSGEQPEDEIGEKCTLALVMSESKLLEEEEEDEDYDVAEEGEETEDDAKNTTSQDSQGTIIGNNNLDNTGGIPLDDNGEKRKRRADDDWRPGHGKKKFKGQKKNHSSTPSPPHPSRLPSFPSAFSAPNKKSPPLQDNKLSFQEAAIRVLSEQRQKGNYALSTRKIWELIAQAGLVDTKCKTPVSSLSSRITEDVRTKGNKSVFVRVGEGLYTLRKGLKKNELEKYLNTKYPHMSHNLDSDGKLSDEKEFEDEISIEDDKYNTIHVEEPSWIGLPLKAKLNGDLYYSAVRVDKYKFKIGDCAYFTPNSEDQTPYVGQITKMWQTKVKPSSGLPSDQMLVQCVWYYYPEDTHVGRSKKHHKNEVFLSDLSDVNTVDSLLSPAEVVSYDEYNKRINFSPKKEIKDLFFCRQFYSENDKEFYDLNIEGNGHFEMDGYTPDKVLQIPKHWPKGIEFTNSLQWRRVSEMVKKHLQIKSESIVELKKLSKAESKGRSKIGVFAIKDIKQGTIIGEYAGDLRVNGEDEDSEPSSHNPQLILFEDDDISVGVDTTQSGNEFKFIGDCNNKKLTPNVNYVPVYLNERWHLIVISLVNIKKGEELIADLKSHYCKNGVLRPIMPEESISV